MTTLFAAQRDDRIEAPGANGTTRRTGLFGYVAALGCCADAVQHAPTSNDNATKIVLM